MKSVATFTAPCQRRQLNRQITPRDFFSLSLLLFCRFQLPFYFEMCLSPCFCFTVPVNCFHLFVSPVLALVFWFAASVFMFVSPPSWATCVSGSRQSMCFHLPLEFVCSASFYSACFSPASPSPLRSSLCLLKPDSQQKQNNKNGCQNKTGN